MPSVFLLNNHFSQALVCGFSNFTYMAKKMLFLMNLAEHNRSFLEEHFRQHLVCLHLSSSLFPKLNITVWCVCYRTQKAWRAQFYWIITPSQSLWAELSSGQVRWRTCTDFSKQDTEMSSSTDRSNKLRYILLTTPYIIIL